MKDRADKVIVSRGLVETQQKAQALIMAGLVFSGNQRIEKPGQMLSSDQDILLKEKLPFVSRGGLKLDEALKTFGIDVKGRIAADLGASTGGFTDCLLQRGAKRVYAVDVDTRQIDWRFHEDSRVLLIEKNARYLDRSDFSEDLDIITMDLSFISVLKVFPAIKKFLGEGKLLSLIKPQFEAGRGQVGKKGIIRDPSIHEEVLNDVINKAAGIGFNVSRLMRTSFLGQKGNQEFFALWSLGETSLRMSRVQKLIREAIWNEKN